ncbi:alanine racemase [Caulobacter mirabilis]|uniref:Amino acid aldolase n=1 Tax=Caulobacter mirabilis TaxID=69666 RepID=A0A2D2AZF4_9CAUL|nr:alanine racemase [Caulobacter mirabilis]ATQ43372.1 amino acid aldolase [Caulobacter mirabilis]
MTLIAQKLDLTDLRAAPLPSRGKGLPLAAAGVRRGDVVRQGWRALRDLPTPFCLIRRSALDHNRRVMGDYLRRAGVELCPHGKTTLAPQLLALQAEDGAWGFTAATIDHLRLYRDHGITRIIFANQLVDPLAIRFLASELDRDPAFEVSVLVDGQDGLDLLRREIGQRRKARPLGVLVEMGAAGGRTGVRDPHAALELARCIAASPGLELRGVETYEGAFAGADKPEISRRVGELLNETARLANATSAEGLFAVRRPIVTAGGSSHFEQVVRVLRARLDFDAEIVLRSGCYLTDDHGFYAASRTDGGSGLAIAEPFKPALEVWGHVQSRPQPDLSILTLGKRDVSYDLGLPVPILWAPADGDERPRPIGDGFEVLRLNDQHAYLRTPPDHPLRAGDRVGVGVSHPCTTFDKWRFLALVDDDGRIEEIVETFF